MLKVSMGISEGMINHQSVKLNRQHADFPRWGKSAHSSSARLTAFKAITKMLPIAVKTPIVCECIHNG